MGTWRWLPSMGRRFYFEKKKKLRSTRDEWCIHGMRSGNTRGTHTGGEPHTLQFIIIIIPIGRSIRGPQEGVGGGGRYIDQRGRKK